MSNTYRIHGARFLRKYTAAEKSSNFAYMADVRKIADTLCKVPWDRVSADVAATNTIHTEEGLDWNAPERERFDAAEWCAEHSDGFHRAYAQAACYVFKLPDSAVGKAIEKIRVNVTSDPYNPYGARIAAMTSATLDIPMDCATVREGEVFRAPDEDGMGAAPRLFRNNADGTQTWYSNSEIVDLEPGETLTAKRYLFVFVCLENYNRGRDGWIEGSSYIDNDVELTLSAAASDFVSDELNDCSAVVEPVEFNVARNGVLPSLVTGVSGVQVCDVLGNGDPVVGDTVRSFGGANVRVGNSAPVLAGMNGHIDGVFLSNVWSGNISSGSATREVSVQLAAIVGDFQERCFGLRGLRIVQVCPFAGSVWLQSSDSDVENLPAEIANANVKYASINISSVSYSGANNNKWFFRVAATIRIATENGFIDNAISVGLYAREGTGVDSESSLSEQDGISFKPYTYETDNLIGCWNQWYFWRGDSIFSIGNVRLNGTNLVWRRTVLDWPVGKIIAATVCKYSSSISSVNKDSVCVLNRKKNAGGYFRSFVYCFGATTIDLELPFDIVSGRVSFFGMPCNVGSNNYDTNLVKGYVSGSFDYVSDGVTLHTDRGLIFEESSFSEIPDSDSDCEMLYRGDGVDYLRIDNENYRRRYFIENAESKISIGVDRCVGLRAAYNRLYTSGMRQVSTRGACKVGAAFAVRIEPSVLREESEWLGGNSSRISILTSIVTIPFSCPLDFVANRIRIDWGSWGGAATSGSLFNVWLKRDSYLVDVGEDVVKDGRIYTADGGAVSGFELIGRINAAASERSAVFQVDPIRCKNATILLSAFVSMDRVNPGANDETITAGVGGIDGANGVVGGWLPDITLIG